MTYNDNFNNSGAINRSNFLKNRYQLSVEKTKELVSRLYQPNIGKAK